MIRYYNIFFITPCRYFRGRGCVLQSQETGKFQQKLERTMTKLMQKKFGLRFEDYNAGLNKDTTISDLSVGKISPAQSMNGSMNPRKAKLYSHVLFKHITQAVSDGAFDDTLGGLDVVLTKVCVHSAFAWTDIHWLASGEAVRDEKIQASLNSITHELKHYLTNQSLVGYIPPIRFVGDYSGVNWEKVDRILSTADFGPNHVPSTSASALKSEIVIQKELSPEIFSKLLGGDKAVVAFSEECLSSKESCVRIADEDSGRSEIAGEIDSMASCSDENLATISEKKDFCDSEDYEFWENYKIEKRNKGVTKDSNFVRQSGINMSYENNNSYTDEFMSKFKKLKIVEEEKLRKLQHIREMKRKMRKRRNNSDDENYILR